MLGHMCENPDINLRCQSSDTAHLVGEKGSFVGLKHIQ